MNESMDRALDDWLHERPENGSREGLERALAATRRVGQRPGWTFPERWLPVQLTMVRTPTWRPTLGIVTVALLILAVMATAIFIGSQRRDTSPFRNGALVFEQDGDLFIVDQLGATPRPLVADPGADEGPIFSPQGDRIAFVRDAGPDGWGIMTVRPDGSGLTQLGLAPDTIDQGPILVWAPDGSALLATSRFPVCCPGLAYVFEVDGSPSGTLDVGGDAMAEGRTAWRPGSRHIAVLGGDGVSITNADGTNVRRLLIGPGEAFEGPLEWSPDGKHLSLWNGNPDDLRITIADIERDGTLSGSHQLATRFDGQGPLGQRMLGPTWSPDGEHLAVALEHESTVQVRILAPDGSEHRIDGPTVIDLWPESIAWSPDGRSIVVSGDALWNDPETHSNRIDTKTWLVDVATSAWTELQTPVQSWQRLAP